MCKYPTSLLTSRPISIAWAERMELVHLAWLQGTSKHAQNEHQPPCFASGYLSHALNQCFYCVSFQDMIISGLQPETSYSLTVTAYTTKGDGARSKPKLVSTTGAGNVFCAYLHRQLYFRLSDGMDLIYYFFLMIHWGEIKCDQLEAFV